MRDKGAQQPEREGDAHSERDITREREVRRGKGAGRASRQRDKASAAAQQNLRARVRGKKLAGYRLCSGGGGGGDHVWSPSVAHEIDVVPALAVVGTVGPPDTKSSQISFVRMLRGRGGEGAVAELSAVKPFEMLKCLV